MGCYVVKTHFMTSPLHHDQHIIPIRKLTSTFCSNIL